jgi:multiple sugar transport system ATP-binding protein
MNVWDGHADGGVLRGEGFALPAPADAAAFGVRPEQLAVEAGAASAEIGPGADGAGPAPAGSPGDGLRLVGEVVVSERLGAERTVYVRTAAGVLAVRVDAGQVLTAGMPVVLRAPLSALTFFGSVGGRLHTGR